MAIILCYRFYSFLVFYTFRNYKTKLVFWRTPVICNKKLPGIYPGLHKNKPE
jgi:hypothetical protein